ncbi:ferredoxin [Planktothrix sp. FACHB-1355]|uniref:Ferredoxin n=1 Tax=Aerosakkonema funiforme FACHB-1375 TaxID=2949571 RepID=A0A926VF79_9CYAN|nr:ferredoxin [Planktothrix sp. FACHB-1355]MBD2182653.1 ferredoxin [Aerosakkonema funiforme FACHB-1375]MBD3558369.1 ferredoxin [Planktothrix sp. FACHB-1355]
MSDFSGPRGDDATDFCLAVGDKNSTVKTTDSTRSGFEPELGGVFRDEPERSGFEPELGGVLRQKGVYVDEITCIGCKHCAHVARNTFYIEPDYGRSRVVRQDGDSEELIQEAIDTCPVDCIHWVDYTELKKLEAEREEQVIPPVVGFPVDRALLTTKRRQQKRKPKRNSEGVGHRG